MNGAYGDRAAADPFRAAVRAYGHVVVLDQYPTPELARAAEIRWHEWRAFQRARNGTNV